MIVLIFVTDIIIDIGSAVVDDVLPQRLLHGIIHTVIPALPRLILGAAPIIFGTFAVRFFIRFRRGVLCGVDEIAVILTVIIIIERSSQRGSYHSMTYGELRAAERRNFFAVQVVQVHQGKPRRFFIRRKFVGRSRYKAVAVVAYLDSAVAVFEIMRIAIVFAIRERILIGFDEAFRSGNIRIQSAAALLAPFIRHVIAAVERNARFRGALEFAVITGNFRRRIDTDYL